MDDCCSAKSCELERIAQQGAQRRVLTAVLLINALMFLVEFAAGIVAGSASLMADAVDMLGDAFVYGLSLFALSRGARWKAGAALAKGGFILTFGLGVLVEVSILIATGVPPSSPIMLAVGGVALIANLSCLALLWRHRAVDVNMSSTFECSRNDVIANVGVLAAASAVSWLNSPWPDIIVGTAIAVLFLRSAARVLRTSWPQFRRSEAVAASFVVTAQRPSSAPRRSPRAGPADGVRRP